MGEQLLSTDPSAGLLSSDPHAGVVKTPVNVPNVSPLMRRAGVSADSAEPSWFDTHLRPAMESSAHPQTLEDLVALLMAPTDPTRGVGLKTIANALPESVQSVPQMVRGARSMAGSGARAVGDAITSPRQSIRKVLNFIGDRMAPTTTPGRYGAPTDVAAPPAGTMAPPMVEPPPAAPPNVAPPVAQPVAPPSSARPAGPSSLSPKAQIDAATQAANVKLNGRELADMFAAVKSGRSADETLTELLGKRATPAPAAAPTPIANPGTRLMDAAKKAGIQLKADEFSGGVDLINKHMSPEQVVEMIQRVRQLPDSFRNLPSNAEVEAKKYFPKGGRKTPNQH